MRFLILALNYLLESISIGPYTADLAEYLQQRGHHVLEAMACGWPVVTSDHGAVPEVAGDAAGMGAEGQVHRRLAPKD
jgi:glycosyltransferase involved in cell wall biosynthesis